jgi:hypothetical protein
MASVITPHESIDQRNGFVRLSDGANMHGATPAF